MTKRMLICYAHPDDESFGLGAFIAKMTAEGVEVYLICATNGEVGTVSPEKLKGYQSIAELRSAELDCATAVLKLKEVIRLNYRDSGMMGTPDNNHPEALWAADLGGVTAKVVEVMQRIKPQVVLTFNEFGGYGHPDHIKIQRATVAAFEQLRGTADAPQRLLYTSLPTLPIKFGILLMRLMGRDPRRMGLNKDIDFVRVVEAADTVHVQINVDAYFEIGQQAGACHASQSSPRAGFPLGEFIMRRVASSTGFTMVYPPAQPNSRMENDLFIGVTE